MTNRELNHLRMVVTRKGVMNMTTYQPLWNTNTKISAAKTNVETIFAQILADAGIQEEDLKGTTASKENAWLAAAQLANHVCTGIRAYAEYSGNTNLYGMMHYTKSELERGEVQETLNKMNLIYNQAILIPIANLADFYITSLILTNFNNAIQAFTTAVPQHAILQALKKTSTTNITNNFKLLRKAGKTLNNLVHTLRFTQGSFVQTYDNACIIINLGKGQMSEEEHLMPGEHVALFTKKFLTDDTFTIRNHSEMAKIKVFLSDNTDVPATGGIEIPAKAELKLSIPTAFKMPFAHTLIVLNEAAMDDAHVTVILAHGNSHSIAPEPSL